MGGKAIAKARRVSKDEYDKVIKHIESQKFAVPRNTLIEPSIIDDSLTSGELDRRRGALLDVDTLRGLGFEFITGTVVKSYRNKEDFGDIDVVIDDRVDIVPIFAHFRPMKCAVNGNVMSFAYDSIQVDFIRTPKEYIRSSLDYFAYNDLGNLLGKIARALGFKYGNKGLIYPYKDEKGNVLEDILVTQNLREILSVLGLSHDRYAQGFNDLKAIFQFVVSSGYFNPSLYLFSHASGKDRVRDEKRKTYQAFLAWIAKYGFKETDRDEQKALLAHQHDQILRMYPHVQTLCDALDQERAADVRFRSRFNGTVITQLTGLEGPALGKFTGWFRGMHHRDFLMRLSDEQLHACIKEAHEQYGPNQSIE